MCKRKLNGQWDRRLPRSVAPDSYRPKSERAGQWCFPPFAENLSAYALEILCCHPRIKSAITAGAAVSNPTTSSMPASFGSAIENFVAVMPVTTSFAAMPLFLR